VVVEEVEEVVVEVVVDGKDIGIGRMFGPVSINICIWVSLGGLCDAFFFFWEGKGGIKGNDQTFPDGALEEGGGGAEVHYRLSSLG
jgi:hypothetical protein